MISYANMIGNIASTASSAIQNDNHQLVKLPTAPGKWSKIQILGHLVDSAYNNHRRFVLARKQTDLIFDGYDQDMWVEANGYQNLNPAVVSITFLTVSMHFSALILQVPSHVMRRKTVKHNFDKICMNPVAAGKEVSLDYLVWDYIAHMEHHLGQIIPDYVPILDPYQPQS